MKINTTHAARRVKHGVLAVAIFGSIAALPASVYGAADNTTINVNIDSTISIGTTATVNLNITPLAGGAQTSAKDTITVSTNNVDGYDITLADADSNTDLVNGANTIAAASTTPSTAAALSNNTWGWHVDGLESFGSDGAVESNVTTSSIKYAGMPASGSAFNIKSSNTTATADTVEIWYAAKVDTSKPNGTYTDTVTYTATTK